MSHQATTWVMEFSKSHLADRLVLGAIAHRVSNDDGDAWPSIKRIMKESNLSERQVYDSIKSLCKMGELEVRDEPSERGTNRYHLPLFISWVQSLHPAQNAGAQSAKHPLHNVQQTPAQNAPEPSLTVSNTTVSTTCSACGETGIHKCPGRLNQKQRAKRSQGYGRSKPMERVDYAAKREADKAERIARENARILANLQARSRRRGD